MLIDLNVALKCSLEDIPNIINYSDTNSAFRKKIYKTLRSSCKLTESEFRILKNWVLNGDNNEDCWPEKIACGVLPAFLEMKFDEVFDLIITLSESESWGMREDATWAIRDLFDFNFNIVYPKMYEIAKFGSDYAARGIAVGLARHCRNKKSEEATPVLEIMSIIAHRRDPYVRKNLGKFAIGDYLLSYYPEETLNYIFKKWIDNDSEYVRWNAAMSFSTSVASKFYDEACRALDLLAADPNRMVWRASASAMLALYRRTDGRPRYIIDQWVNDDKRKNAGNTVLKFVLRDENKKK